MGFQKTEEQNPKREIWGNQQDLGEIWEALIFQRRPGIKKEDGRKDEAGIT